jgi:hypothetical protein
VPTSLADRKTRHSVGSVPGLDALEELAHAGLTHVDPQGKRVAKLAEAVPAIENGLWQVMPDGRMQTTWKLRESARWHVRGGPHRPAGRHDGWR